MVGHGPRVASPAVSVSAPMGSVVSYVKPLTVILALLIHAAVMPRVAAMAIATSVPVLRVRQDLTAVPI